MTIFETIHRNFEIFEEGQPGKLKHLMNSETSNYVFQVPFYC